MIPRAAGDPEDISSMHNIPIPYHRPKSNFMLFLGANLLTLKHFNIKPFIWVLLCFYIGTVLLKNKVNKIELNKTLTMPIKNLMTTKKTPKQLSKFLSLKAMALCIYFQVPLGNLSLDYLLEIRIFHFF